MSFSPWGVEFASLPVSYYASMPQPFFWFSLDHNPLLLRILEPSDLGNSRQFKKSLALSKHIDWREKQAAISVVQH